jgi:MFS family permease
MVVLDATIVNIALPSAQQDLGFSTDSRQWVVTAYALAFGSLLLIGGRLGDLFGRKWTFVGGLIGFAVASFIGGLAPSFGVLVVARALQGIFGALLAPAALGLLTVTFADSPDRPKAFGIFAAVATAGASVGLLLGGVLTDALSWRSGSSRRRGSRTAPGSTGSARSSSAPGCSGSSSASPRPSGTRGARRRP